MIKESSRQRGDNIKEWKGRLQNSIGLTLSIGSGQISEISGSNTLSTCMYYGLLVLCDSLRNLGEHECGLRAAGKRGKRGV